MKPGNVLLSWALQYLEEYYAAVDLVQTPLALATQVLSRIPPAAPGFKKKCGWGDILEARSNGDSGGC